MGSNCSIGQLTLSKRRGLEIHMLGTQANKETLPRHHWGAALRGAAQQGAAQRIKCIQRPPRATRSTNSVYKYGLP